MAFVLRNHIKINWLFKDKKTHMIDCTSIKYDVFSLRCGYADWVNPII